MPNVIGIFDNASQAHAAVERMINAGIDRDQISLVTRDSTQEMTHEETEERTSGAGKGAGIGAAVGGIGGLIAGIAGLAIPGIGPILAAGPIAAALGGALGGAGLGAAAGGLIGALTDMGVPEEQAREYEDHVRQGKTLVTVRAISDNEADRASNIMEVQGAVDVEGRSTEDNLDAAPEYSGARSLDAQEVSHQRGVADTGEILSDRGVGAAQSTTTSNLTSGRDSEDLSKLNRQDLTANDTETIPVTEEQLALGKRAVESGRVRIYGRETEKPVEASVQLRDEKVTIERRAVDRPVDEAARRGDVTIDITETREEPVVGKQERVVEEVVVGKTVEERTETVRDKVRRKDVEVERTGSEPEKRTRGRR